MHMRQEMYTKSIEKSYTERINIIMCSGTSTIDCHAWLNAQIIKWIKFKHNNQLSNLPYCHMVFIHPINTDFSNNNNNSSRKYNITPLTIPQQMYVNYQWFNMTWKHTTSPTLICGVKQHTCIHNNQPYIYIYIFSSFVVYDIIGIIHDTIHETSTNTTIYFINICNRKTW